MKWLKCPSCSLVGLKLNFGKLGPTLFGLGAHYAAPLCCPINYVWILFVYLDFLFLFFPLFLIDRCGRHCYYHIHIYFLLPNINTSITHILIYYTYLTFKISMVQILNGIINYDNILKEKCYNFFKIVYTTQKHFIVSYKINQFYLYVVIYRHMCSNVIHTWVAIHKSLA